MIRTLVLAAALALLGDTCADALNVPVPGAVIGMIIVAILFAMRGGVDAGSARLFDAVAPHFSLFFVPAAVGVVASAELLANSWLYVTAAIVLGTTATIAITGMLGQHLLKLLGKVG